jgi:hypothetical protein
MANEIVHLTLDKGLKAQDGTQIRPQGYAASFRIATAPATRQFSTLTSWSVSTGSFARIYGGQSCDLNRDGFSDLAVICEVASDVRVYLSNHDATGSFAPLFGTPNSVGSTPSPNENADMNGDGLTDVITCQYGDGTTSILLGNGDGSFQPAATYSMSPGGCYGLAVFDANGDGFPDVAQTGSSGKVELRLNNGDGTLGALTSITTSIAGDYGLTAADMNNDGIVDLIVGGSSAIMVLLSNGDGSFTSMPAQNSGGFCWMLVCGDVNNDGNMDVSIANGGGARGSIVLGNGNGTLQAAFSTPAFGHTTATDLGDLDGDGDLDWVLSSYGAGIYQVWTSGLFHSVRKTSLSRFKPSIRDSKAGSSEY